LLYLANDTQGAGLRMAVPSHEGANNAYIWDAGVQALSGADPANTWANHVSDHVKFHIGNGNPLYEGSFTYEMSNGLGAMGTNTVGVRNVETEKDGSYWTLDRSDSEEGEVLLGLDGRNKITGGDGDDIIHGGHDSSGDILMGGGGDDVIFGGSGNDDLQGGDGDDTFIMSAGFGRDDVDGGDGIDTITLDSVLTGADVAVGAIGDWLTLNDGATFSHDAGTITFEGGEAYSGTIDLGGGNEITFDNIEQIVYTGVA
jgi:Ca2+-binding RTX toxin-like protein